jgi:hypothetical protein
MATASKLEESSSEDSSTTTFFEDLKAKFFFILAKVRIARRFEENQHSLIAS